MVFIYIVPQITVYYCLILLTTSLYFYIPYNNRLLVQRLLYKVILSTSIVIFSVKILPFILYLLEILLLLVGIKSDKTHNIASDIDMDGIGESITIAIVLFILLIDIGIRYIIHAQKWYVYLTRTKILVFTSLCLLLTVIITILLLFKFY